MAIAEAYANTVTISVTEISLTTGGTFSANTGIATDGIYQVFIDTNAMIAGDQFQVAVYERVNSGSTQRLADIFILTGAQQKPLLVLPSLLFLHAWDVTLKKLAGTDRSFSWSIRQVT